MGNLSITAGTTRTQAGATAITEDITIIATSTAPAAGTTLGDGVVLPSLTGGNAKMFLVNNTANPVQVYANGSDTINGVAGTTGVVLPAGGTEVFVQASPGAWTAATGVGASGNYQTLSSVDSLTAHAGGGQASATALTAMQNRVTTVATAADSVKLPASAAGMQIVVVNAAAANSMNVFPATGDAINALAVNTAFAVAAGKTAQFNCITAGQWHSILSA